MEQHVVETQEEYDTLMVDLESRGMMWLSGKHPTEWRPMYLSTSLPLEISIGYCGLNKITFKRM